MKYIQKNSYGVLIDRTIRKIKKDLELRFKSNSVPITVDEFVILDRLAKKTVANPRELAEITFKDGPTITRLCDKLVKKGLIVRTLDENDRRKVKIEITKSGKKELKNATPIVLENRKVGWDGLNHEDYEKLIFIMEKIHSNFS